MKYAFAIGIHHKYQVLRDLLKMARRKKVLVAVLNWGLGHATRMVPIIRLLTAHRTEVHIASDGLAQEYLKRSFPGLTFHELPPYKISYGPKGALPSVMFRFPGVLQSVIRERREVSALISKLSFDLIISDNRYGCFHKHCKSVFVGHQLRIPTNNLLLRRFSRMFFYGFDRNFDELWVPDYSLPPRLMGDTNEIGSKKLFYIGPLSAIHPKASGKAKTILLIASGPEPDRSRFEKKVTDQLSLLGLDFQLASAIPGQRNRDRGFRSSQEMERLYESADVVISRPGYSTVMDLCQTSCKALFIPVKNQPEHLFLARNLKNSGIAHWVSESRLNLANDLPAARRYKGFSGQEVNLKCLDDCLHRVLGSIN